MKVSINYELSPVKHLILFIPENEKKIVEIIKALNTTWAGLYSPILPFYKDYKNEDYSRRYSIKISLKEYYINVTNNYDPDIIVYDDDIDVESISEILKDRVSIPLKEFIDSVNKNQLEFGIGIDLLIDDLNKNEFKYKRIDSLKLSIPKIEKDNLFLSAWIGNVIDTIHSELVEKSLINYDWYRHNIVNYENLNDFLNQNLISTVQLGKYKVNILSENNNRHLCYVLDTSEWLNILDFWNLRALGLEVLPIPHDKINEAPFTTNLMELLNEKFITSTTSFKSLEVLIAPKLNSKEILKKLDKVKFTHDLKEMRFTEINWFPRFWDYDKEILMYDSVFCPKYIFEHYVKEAIVDENELITMSFPFLPFETRVSNSGLFKSYLSFSYWNNEGKYAGIISDITTKDWYDITKAFSYSRGWRVNNGNIIKFIRHEGENEYCYLPKSYDFFAKYFSNKGFSITELPSTKLAKEVLYNLGGIHGTNILSSQNAIKIIELFEGGKPIAYENLIGKIQEYKPFSQIKNPNDFIQLLLDKKIIEFGLNIRCKICEQKSFYLINELKNTLQCSICRNIFEIPQNNPKETFKYAYRGLGSFSKDNKVDGLLCVFLTLRLFKLDLADSDKKISFIMDFEIKKGNIKHEVDLAIITEHYKNKWKPTSFICECKTFKSFTKKDLDRLILLGKNLSNVVLVVSTLKEEFDDTEKDLLKNLVNTFRNKENFSSTNPVLLLTSNELIPEKRVSALNEYMKGIHMHNHIDYIQHLSDLTCERHLEIKTMSDLIIEDFRKRDPPSN